MIYHFGQLIFWTIFSIGVLGLIIFADEAFGAEAIMPIKVRIIDCSTPEKALEWCTKEGKCCHLIEVGE